MDQDIVFKASIDDGGKGGKSLATLRKEFQELNKELDKAEVGTKKYNDTLKKLGAVKDDIGDLRSTIDALNPEGKVGAFVNVAGKLAGGFQAATGAAALFGVQSEELEQTLLKVQAATAFAEGIRSIAGMGDSFRVLGTVIKTNVVTALGTLKGALAATGIGALVVAIGILINEVMEYNEAIEEEYDKQRKLNEELKKTTDEYLKQAQASEELRNRRRGGLNELERELKLLEASGATAAEIANKKAAILDAEIFNLKVRQATIAGNAEEEEKLAQLILDKETEKTALILAYQKKVDDDAAESARKKKELRDKDLQERIEAEEYWNQFSRENDEIIAEAEATAAGEKSKEEIRAREEEAALANQIFEEDLARITAEGDANRKARKIKLAEEEENERKIAAAKQQIEATTFRAARDLSTAFFQSKLNAAKGNAQAELEIRKKQFQVEKAFNVARATIDGARAVLTAIASSPPPFNAILAGISAVAAAAQIAVIAGQQFDGGSAGIGSIQAPSTSTPSVSAPPDAPTVNRIDSTRLSESGQVINVKAEVVETEATFMQKRIARLKSQATF